MKAPAPAPSLSPPDSAAAAVVVVVSMDGAAGVKLGTVGSRSDIASFSALAVGCTPSAGAVKAGIFFLLIT